MLSVLSLLVYYCRFLSLLVAAFCDTHQLLLPLFPAPVAVGCCFCHRRRLIVAFVAAGWMLLLLLHRRLISFFLENFHFAVAVAVTT